MKSKVAISLLLLAITLYIVSALFYFYEAREQGLLPVINYPFRDYALPLTGVASVLLVIAGILFLRRK